MTGTRASELFGQRMRELRQERGLTQAELSDRSGFPQGRISEMERGARLPNLITMIRIAVALDCTLRDLTADFDKAGLSSFISE
jgi:transcriptional regulator with XRE-family HTH domain